MGSCKTTAGCYGASARTTSLTLLFPLIRFWYFPELSLFLAFAYAPHSAQLKPITLGGESMEDTHTHHHHWRKRAEHAVRQFAATSRSVNDAELRRLVATMLGAVGDALDLDCCTIVDAPVAADKAVHGYHWTALADDARAVPLG